MDGGSGSVNGDDGIGGPSALDPLGAESLAVGLPMGEAVCFLLVGITMADHDVLGDVASACGKGTDMVIVAFDHNISVPCFLIDWIKSFVVL